MTTTAISNWYQTNWQSLQSEIERIRHLLECYIEENSSDSQADAAISPPVALGQLSSKFNLQNFERDILFFCVGTELDPNFADLCAQAAGNLNQNYPTLSLALGAFPSANFFVLSPHNPIQRWKMIEFAPGLTLTQAAMRIDQRILCYLLGVPAVDQHLLGIASFPDLAHPAINLPPSQQAIADQLIATWSNSPKPLPHLQLCGVDYSSKYHIFSNLCDRLNYNLGIISTATLPTSPNDIYQLTRRWEREAILSDRVLFLVCDHSTDDPHQKAAISLFIENINTPLIISSRERLQNQQRALINFDIPSLSFEEQTAIWSTHLGAEAINLKGEITVLASQFNLNYITIQAACQQTKSAETSSLEQLWNFCRTQARPQLDNLAQRIDTTAQWTDLVLPERPVQVLKDIADQLQQRHKVYRNWGFAKKSGRGLGITALFYGDSGTGKTMAAELLANQFRLDLYRIDLSAVVSKYIGETEKNLARIFDAAETGGAILLFDEADALFGKRSEVKDSHDRHANVEVSYLLQRMEAYQGLAILTTNLKDALDNAFMRRIRFMVDFPFPTPELRSQIWEHIFPALTPTQGLDYKKLGQLQVAGGNIRNIAMISAFLAANENEPVKMKHIKIAAQREYMKLKKLLTDTEVQGWA
ncbi:AAA ATPase central domain-containing protein [Cylindrospermum sp. NIES-4074]|nr:AAA ATPase central domain-containing protein [Cylindrospermum sp. NIES-4074]